MSGPDLGCYALFNLNNHKLFTHDLMHKYLADMTTSETPFTAFTNSTKRTYCDSNSPIPFVERHDFEKAFFSYSQLFRPSPEDFGCFTCGPFPDVVLVDAINAGYSKQFLTDDIEPPTFTYLDSPVNTYVTPQPRLQIVTDPALRKTALLFIDELEEILQVKDTPQRVRRAKEFHRANKMDMESTTLPLAKIDLHLGALFEMYAVNPSAPGSDWHLPYLKLLRVVCLLLCSRLYGILTEHISCSFSRMNLCSSLHLAQLGMCWRNWRRVIHPKPCFFRRSV
jgi:hypothetical protein